MRLFAQTVNEHGVFWTSPQSYLVSELFQWFNALTQWIGLWALRFVLSLWSKTLGVVGTPAVEGRETFGPFKCRINVLRLTRRCTSHNTVVAPWETLLNKSYAPPRSTQRWVAPADRRLFRSVQNSYEPFFWAYSEFETSVSSENMSSVV